MKQAKSAGVFLVLFGVVVLGLKLGNARVQDLFASDILALVAAGMCFGAGFILVLDRLRARATR